MYLQGLHAGAYNVIIQIFGTGYEGVYFVKEHFVPKNKYSEDDIIKMLDFLVDNIFVGFFAGKMFQKTVNIPMDTN